MSSGLSRSAAGDRPHLDLQQVAAVGAWPGVHQRIGTPLDPDVLHTLQLRRRELRPDDRELLRVHGHRETGTVDVAGVVLGGQPRLPRDRAATNRSVRGGRGIGWVGGTTTPIFSK